MAQKQSGQSNTKGNPAHKRMGNEALKRRRAASRSRGERRTADRRNAQDGRATFNRELRAERQRLVNDGRYAEADELVTPWEDAKRKRKARRVALHGSRTWTPEPELVAADDGR
jgi:hypothetical protein